MKEYFGVQVAWFKDVFKGYTEPFKVLFAFLSVLFELFRQMFISLMMDSEEFDKYQRVKFEEESQGEKLEE